MNKKLILLGSLLFCSVLCFAQEDQISLPDVTTVVTGESEGLNIPAPDLNKSVKLPKKSSSVTPQMPDIKEKAPVVVEEKPAPKPASLMVEGRVGGGYPANILANFLIQQLGLRDTFSLLFNHDSFSAFGGSSQPKNFSASDTDIYLFKRFQLDRGVVDFTGFYGSVQNGFQNQIQDLTPVNQNIAKGKLGYSMSIRGEHKLNLAFGTDFYSRYNDITNITDTLDSWQEESVLLFFVPTASYSKAFFDDALVLGASAAYNLDMDIKGTLVDEQTIYTNGRSLNRGELLFNSEFKKEYFDLFGSAGLVFGDHQNDNSVIVPFTLKVVTRVPIKTSIVTFCLAGGMESAKTSVNEEEQKYKYTAFSTLPSECSAWYGHFDTAIPFGNNFKIAAAIDYKKTAFNNGYWEAEYSADGYNGGLFQYRNVEKEIFSTEVSALYEYGFYKLQALGKVNFMDLEPLESKYNYNVCLEYDPQKRFSGSVLVKGALDSSDMLPQIDLEGTINLTENEGAPLKLSLYIQDLLKLASGSTRMYGGDYFSESGKISLIMKFKY